MGWSDIASAGFRVVFVHSLGADGVCTCGESVDHRSAGKHPILHAWQKKATNDVAILQDQVSRLKRAEYNVGIVLGEQPDGRYLVCIDRDDADRYAELVAELGELPATNMSQTPRGDHLLFVWPDGSSPDGLVNGHFGNAPGVDYKVQNGQVVVEGVQPKGAYWGFDPRASIATLPMTWAIAMLPALPAIPQEYRKYTPQLLRTDRKAMARAEKYFSAAVIGRCSDLSRVGEGGRNTALRTAANYLFALASGMHMTHQLAYLRRELENAALSSGLEAREAVGLIERSEEHVMESGAVCYPREVPAPAPTRALEAVARATTGAGLVVARDASDGAEGSPAWGRGGGELILDTDGQPAKIAANVATALKGYHRGQPRLDTYRRRVVWADGDVVHESDAVEVQGWLYGLHIRAGLDTVREGIERCASECQYNSLTEWLRSLVWDGERRVDRLASHYLGAVGEHEYLESVSRCFLLGAANRGLNPGCQLDTALVLEGNQGALKSSFIRVLAGQGNSASSYIDLNRTPDKYQALLGKWLYELEEIDKYADARSQGKLKSYISDPVDSFRPSYRRDVADYPRTVAFVGTTNETNYLGDTTGGRRYHPVVCREIRLDEVARDREQLWAEAVHRLGLGERYWLTSSEETAQAEVASNRVMIEPWAERTASWVNARRGERFHTWEVVEGAVGVMVSKQDWATSARMGAILRQLGLVNKSVKVNGNVVRLWCLKGS